MVEKNPEFSMTDDEFETLKALHLSNCEKFEMQGLSNHLLYICKKN